jgi:hypothetical protein
MRQHDIKKLSPRYHVRHYMEVIAYPAFSSALLNPYSVLVPCSSVPEVQIWLFGDPLCQRIRFNICYGNGSTVRGKAVSLWPFILCAVERVASRGL